jgi:enoyl-[acyl-carrier protein] reductase III
MGLALDGRVALVTGGTRGVGLAVARKLAASGCRLLVNYAGDDEAAKQAMAELDRIGAVASLLKGDVGQLDELRGMLAGLDRLDILVHCAVAVHRTPATAVALGGFHRDLAVAVNPLLYAAPSLATLMAGRAGRVVAVSSIGARRAIAGYASLGMAKAALESLVRYLAVELAGQGIAVNAVATSKLDKGPQTRDPETARVLAARTPGGRLTTPADVADVVALLCTPEAGWIHGQVITVDGGLSARA